MAETRGQCVLCAVHRRGFGTGDSFAEGVGGERGWGRGVIWSFMGFGTSGEGVGMKHVRGWRVVFAEFLEFVGLVSSKFDTLSPSFSLLYTTLGSSHEIF